MTETNQVLNGLLAHDLHNGDWTGLVYGETIRVRSSVNSFRLLIFLQIT